MKNRDGTYCSTASGSTTATSTSSLPKKEHTPSIFSTKHGKT